MVSSWSSSGLLIKVLLFTVVILQVVVVLQVIYVNLQAVLWIRIRIQLTSWIRIRIQNADPDPVKANKKCRKDPGVLTL